MLFKPVNDFLSMNQSLALEQRTDWIKKLRQIPVNREFVQEINSAVFQRDAGKDFEKLFVIILIN